jgi:hypothetical protein
MSKDEWIETAIIFVALALLWVPILGLQQWWLRGCPLGLRSCSTDNCLAAMETLQ